MPDEVLDLEVVAKESTELAITGDIKTRLVDQLAEVSERIPQYQAFAKTFKCVTIQDATTADEKLSAILADKKIIENKGGMLSLIKTNAGRFHKRICAFESLHYDPLESANKTIKFERDEFTRREKAKAEAEAARLNAIEQERIRKERQIEEQKAAAARAIEQQKEREAAAARQAAAAAEGVERARLQREAAAADRAAAAARAKAEVREEAAASKVATVIDVVAPAARKGARQKWRVKSVDKKTFLAAVANDETLHGLVEINEDSLARMKAANTSYKVAGIEFHQVTE